MSMSIDPQFVVTTLRAATPIIIAALAALFSVRAKVFHMGIEGLMLIGAFTAVVAGSATGSAWIGLLASIAVCLVVSLVYWLLTDLLSANTVIVGIGLTTFAAGATAFLMQVAFGQRGTISASVSLPRPVSGVSDGPLAYVSELSIITWLTIPLALLVWVLLRRSRLGLNIAAVGDYPYGALAAGVNPSRTRLVAILITGVGAAIAGAQLSLGDLAGFTENMTNGRGFMALAATIFGALSPLQTALAGLFFGLADALGIWSQIHMQGLLPSQFVLMTPFLVTLLAICVRGGILKSMKRTAN